MERLLIKAKAGDNYAIQLLLNKYKNLLNSASRQHLFKKRHMKKP